MAPRSGTKPFPAGCEIGGHHDTRKQMGGIIRTEWWCMFDYEQPTWVCRYVVDEQVVFALTGTGETPRAAFEQLVSIYTLANGGVESPTLRELLPRMRTLFDDDGHVSPGNIIVKETRG